jgi:HEPN domain-containing protein
MVKHSKRIDGHNESSVLYNAFTHQLILDALSKSDYLEVLYGIGYHCHLLVELVLKACLLHQDNQFPNIHILSELEEKINFLNLDQDDHELLNAIEKMYHFRYPFPLPTEKNKKEAFFDRIKKHREYCVQAIYLVHKISSQMPANLNKTYNEIFERDPLAFTNQS